MSSLDHNAAASPAGSAGFCTAANPVKWHIPLILLACVLLAFFDKISIAALFSDSHFQQSMGMHFDTTRLGLLMSAFLLSYGFSSIFLSALGDRIQPPRLLLGMMLSWCVLMTLMGLTRDYGVMLALRVLLGIAEGPLFPLAFTIVRQHFPQHLQARATMLWLLGTPLGAALGFPLSLFILSRFGWQFTFFFMALLTLPLLLLVQISFRHLRHRLPIGPSATQNYPSRGAARRALWRNRHFWLICLFNIAFLTYLWGINGWLPSYLIEGKGIDLRHAGWLASMPFVGMLLGEVLGAWLADRSDRRALTCFISMAGAGLGLLAVLHLQASWQVVLCFSASAFLWGAGAPNVFALLAKATPARVSATAGGVFNGVGNFAGALAPLVMGALIAFTGEMNTGLIFLVVMATLGCLLLLPILKRY
ncbi:MFS transporter [Pantoea sp. 1.19]|uniref:MFS transporter n=1 Tax=Pantoea sp. 1.19 TaxID=1925589 RepID=UPI000948DAE0|nr:MFS transporter [Pantoea sp. 1.19]